MHKEKQLVKSLYSHLLPAGIMIQFYLCYVLEFCVIFCLKKGFPWLLYEIKLENYYVFWYLNLRNQHLRAGKNMQKISNVFK